MTNDTKHTLPNNWRWAKLGDVISEAQPGFACGERDPRGVIQLRMNNVNTRGNLVWDDFIRVPADSPTITKYQLISGDVVFNNTNSTELVGKSALFLSHSEPIVYSNHFTRLRVKPEKLAPVYLVSWLIYQWQSRVFENLCNRWIGQSAVKNEKPLSLEIPLSASRYKSVTSDETYHEPPQVTLERLQRLEQVMVDEINKLKKMIE